MPKKPVKRYGWSTPSKRYGERRKSGIINGPRKRRLERLPKLSPAKVDALEKAILAEMVMIEEKNPDSYIHYTVESMAVSHNCHPKHVHEVFRRLNRRGLLSQKHRCFAHDTNRNPVFYGSMSGWHANIYYPRLDNVRDTTDEN